MNSTPSASLSLAKVSHIYPTTGTSSISVSAPSIDEDPAVMFECSLNLEVLVGVQSRFKRSRFFYIGYSGMYTAAGSSHRFMTRLT